MPNSVPREFPPPVPVRLLSIFEHASAIGCVRVASPTARPQRFVERFRGRREYPSPPPPIAGGGERAGWERGSDADAGGVGGFFGPRAGENTGGSSDSGSGGILSSVLGGSRISGRVVDFDGRAGADANGGGT
jgi:hypothetical protein